MVRSFRQQGNPPWRLPQRSRPAGVHRNVSESLEQKSQTLRVDRDRRIHSRKAHSLSPDFGADPARLHQPQVQKKEEAMTAYLFSRHYTSVPQNGDRRQTGNWTWAGCRAIAHALAEPRWA